MIHLLLWMCHLLHPPPFNGDMTKTTNYVVAHHDIVAFPVLRA